MDLKEIVESLCPDVDRQLIREFFTRMDEDYFATFSPDEIAAHVRMAARLDPEHRINVLILPRRHATRSEFDIVIVGFDYMSEFSMFCGLLSSFGLDIHEGDIYSFSRSDAGAPPRKIVDVFHVSLKAGEKFDDTRQREFEQELQVLAGFLAAGALDKARERLNRSVTERVEEMNEQLTGLLSPIEIQFDNHRSPSWTVMEVHSANAFGFLYAVSNALAMQGIYIHKVKIRSSSGTVEDQFFMSDYWGRKIEDGPQQDRLRMAVVMIKQFTRFLPEAPDPAKAMLHFDQFLDKLAQEQFPDHIISFFAGEQGMSLLAHLLGSSDFLWDDFLGIHFKDLLPVLEDLTRTELQPGPTYKNYLRRQLRTLVGRGSSFLEKKKALNTFKEDQLFFIDSKHLLDSRVTLTVFSQALTEVAEVVLDEAVEMCLGHLGPGVPGAFTICGLGKFGGQEMGYASDLELLFVHESEAGRADAFFDSLAHAIVDLIQARRGGIFDIDLRLRPYGDAGAWSVPFQEFRKYYSPAGSAAAFERQALTKLRWAAGNEGLGRRVVAHRDTFTYSGAALDWENALHLRERQRRELVKPGQINVKYGAGGIIDIEYTVQYRQILHGRDHPELRAPNTLQALEALSRLGILPRDDCATLRSAYLFLRNVIDALRIVRGDARDLVLPDPSSEEFKSLARRLGYCEGDRKQSAVRLYSDVREQMSKASAEFEKNPARR